MGFIEEKTEDGLEIMQEGLPFFFERSQDIACLVQHGFTSTTSSVREYAEYLAEKGITCLGPRLPGHGTNVRHMGTKTYGDWISRVEEAFEFLSQRYEKIFVTGLSLGGTLSLYLAERHKDRINGVIPVCAPLFLKNPALPLAGLLKYVIKVFPGVAGDIKDPGVTEVAYDKVSVPAIHELVKLMKLVKETLPDISCPIKIFEAREDHVVPPENATLIYDQVRSRDKELVWLDNSYHVATLDYDREKIFQGAFDFIQEKS